MDHYRCIIQAEFCSEEQYELLSRLMAELLTVIVDKNIPLPIYISIEDKSSLELSDYDELC